MDIFQNCTIEFQHTALTEKINELSYMTFFSPANDDLKALFARSKEGSIRTIKVDIQDGML